MSTDQDLELPSRKVVAECVIPTKGIELIRHKSKCDMLKNFWPYPSAYVGCMTEYEKKSDKLELISKYAYGAEVTPEMADALPRVTTADAKYIEEERDRFIRALDIKPLKSYPNQDISDFRNSLLKRTVDHYHSVANNSMKYNY